MKATSTSTASSLKAGETVDREVAQYARLVADDAGRPLDSLAVVAILESNGVRDIDATKLGLTDIFELGKVVFDKAQWAPVKDEYLAHKRRRPIKRLLENVGFFLQGFAFTLPMLGQTALLLMLGVALFASTSLSVQRATLIGGAALASMIATGGFIQAMARRQHFYLGQLEPKLARQAAFRIVLDGMVSITALCALLALVNLPLSAIGWSDLFAFFAYLLSISLLWLSTTVIYVIRREVVAFLNMLIGGLVAYLIIKPLGHPAIEGHIAGLALASAMTLAYGYIELKMRERERPSSTRAILGRRLTAIITAPYFLWGLVYFALILVDRVIAWTSYQGGFQFQFYAIYELGIDWALIVLVLGIGMLEGLVRRFSLRLQSSERRDQLKNIAAHNRRFPRMLSRQVLGVTLVTVALAFLVWFGLPALIEGNGIGNTQLSSGYSSGQLALGTPAAALAGTVKFSDFFEQPLVMFTAAVGMAAYVLLVIGLLSSAYLVRFSRPQIALKAAIPALITDVAVGTVSRIAEGQVYAVYGLFAGALVFMVLSNLLTYRAMKEISYYNCSSF